MQEQTDIPIIPVFAIVGRPNVGKSTLFNYLTKTRNALVADMPGVTRDRQYGDGRVGDRSYIVVDTGGLAEPDDPEMTSMTDEQVEQAIAEADVLLFMVDAKDGRTPADEAIAQRLRAHSGKVVLIVNKSDRVDAGIACADFYQFGLDEPVAISATHGRGIQALMSDLLADFPMPEESDEPGPDSDRISIAVLGRPNVGKSTLINRILGEERVVVLDRPGTTRDSVFIPFERQGAKYTLIDTAGVRRRARVDNAIEKFSIIKTMQALALSHVIIVIIDGHEGLTDQDVRLIGKVAEKGKALIIAVNKWDGLDNDARMKIKSDVDRRLPFVNYARRYFISALHGTGVGDLYHAIDEAYQSGAKEISTNELTRVLMQALEDHQPPLVRGRRIKLRYAHVVKHHPLVIVIHGKQTNDLPGSYKKYLSSYIRKSFKLTGIPVVLQFRKDDNPFIN